MTTGGLGSASEWIKNGYNGILTKYQPQDYVTYLVEIIRGAVRILEDEKLHMRMIENTTRTKILTWEQVGARWLKMLRKLG